MNHHDLLKNSGVDAILLFNSPERNDPNFIYLTDYKNTDAWALISKKPTIYVSPLEINGIKRKGIFSFRPLNKDVYEEIKKTGANRIGINFNFISVNSLKKLTEKLKGIKFVDISEIIEKTRAVKSDKEIERVRKACEISDKILKTVFSEAKKFGTEVELRDFIETLMKRHSVGPSFPTIVATGKNSAVPHHFPDKTKLNGFTVLDFGVCYKNYCSDISRTIYFGRPTKKERRDYVKVLSVQEDCIRMAKPGIPFNRINKYAKKSLGKKMTHSVGHGLGIEVHESPIANSEVGLKKNSIITIEPGIYFNERYGIRIEDDVLVGKKPIALNNAAKDLVLL